MGIFIELENFSQAFLKASIEPIIINDLSCASEDDRLYIDQLISVKYDKTDLFSNEPRCECGDLQGGYQMGVICGNCQKPVSEVFDQQLEPLVWIRAPKGVERLINPLVWTMICKKFSKSNFNFIEWICNTDYHPTSSKPVELGELSFLGIERGYNNFVKNFDKYITILAGLKRFRPKKGEDDQVLQLLREQRECVFSQYLPLPNKTLMVVEDTKVGQFVDPLVTGAIDAIRTISSIDSPLANFTLRQKENRTAKTISMLADFYHSAYSEIFSQKNGLFRKHIFGTRNHFSARAVITSNTKAHRYDELHIAWGHGVTMLRMHLTNKLLRRGYTPNQIAGLLQENTVKYNHLIDELFHELIDESPDKGLPCIFSRNPSLARGSTQRMFITKVKTDVEDPTITLSILSVKGLTLSPTQ